MLKEQENFYSKKVENYEIQINRLNEDAKQMKEKYDK